MNQTKSSSELKSLAKGQLLGSYGRLISALLVVWLVPYAVLFIADDLLPGRAVWENILYYIIYFLVVLLSGIFMLGHAKLYMNFATNRPARLSDVFYGFHGHQDLGILIMLVYIGITFLCLIPFMVTMIAYVITSSVYLWPVMSLTLIAGGIAAYVNYLSLSQSFYIAVDFPNYTLKQVLSMSRRVMKGQRARLFYIQISFLPLILLCVLSFGLGLLWLLPYSNCTMAHFYLDLMEYRTREYQ